MHKGPKRISCAQALLVLPPCVCPHIPAIMRKAQNVVSLGFLNRKRDQRLELRITAHDTVQHHELGGAELRSEAHEVARSELYAPRVTTAGALLFGRGDIGR